MVESRDAEKTREKSSIVLVEQGKLVSQRGCVESKDGFG
jgi:hypothetical protein